MEEGLSMHGITYYFLVYLFLSLVRDCVIVSMHTSYKMIPCSKNTDNLPFHCKGKVRIGLSKIISKINTIRVVILQIVEDCVLDSMHASNISDVRILLQRRTSPDFDPMQL